MNALGRNKSVAGACNRSLGVVMERAKARNAGAYVYARRAKGFCAGPEKTEQERRNRGVTGRLGRRCAVLLLSNLLFPTRKTTNAPPFVRRITLLSVRFSFVRCS